MDCPASTVSTGESLVSVAAACDGSRVEVDGSLLAGVAAVVSAAAVGGGPPPAASIFYWAHAASQLIGRIRKRTEQADLDEILLFG